MKRDAVALVDESRCIGCTRCIDACPVDAIVGAQSLMHTVVEPWCIGCGLCPPACPVDCIAMVAPRGRWTTLLRKAAGERARGRQKRLSKAGFSSSTPERRKRVLAELLSRKR
ncbi:MAG: RnfABCDGE type electron transport complex subunit B [Burkholderiales bacterium]